VNSVYYTSSEEVNFMMSFLERARLGSEQLSEQLPVTLKDAREQAEKLRSESTSKSKKKRDQRSTD
jgi:transcription initiation factor IIE alpha subunit